MHVAVLAARAAGAVRVIVASPVGASRSVPTLRAVADDVVVLATPEPFFAVGEFYVRFDQTGDDEVAACWRAGTGREGAPGPEALEVGTMTEQRQATDRADARPSRDARSHRDAGAATSPDLAGLFVEAAAAFAELAGRRRRGRASPSSGSSSRHPDLAGLAYEWLNELIGLADPARSARRHGDRSPPSRLRGSGTRSRGDGDSWAAPGRALDGRTARSRLGVKSATYHGLRVDPVERG
jgi:SHS2 domain-containing protein